MDAHPEKTRFTAQDLAGLCGVSVRTVRYYVEEALLPPPASRGRGAHFEERHLTRLRLIRAMQEAGNDLDTIGAYLKELEAELSGSETSFESVLAIWRDQARKVLARPDLLHRYVVAEGVELLVEGGRALPPARMRELLKLIRRHFESED
jgi:DNA-binding transcriptional MerR regulator